MKAWFKARNIWGAAIMTLSDTEAGRLMKALWTYTMTGEQPNLSGVERGVFAMIRLTLSEDEVKDAEISEKRAAAGSAGGKQRVANQANASLASIGEANQANALIRIKNKNKNENKNQNKEIREIETEKETEKEKAPEPDQKPARQRPRFVPPTIDQVRAYCQEKKYGVDPDEFIDFYTSKGWKVGNNPMVDWKASLRTWERRKDSKGSVGAKGISKVVVAHEYEQRDYAGVQNELMARQEADMQDFLRREAAE